MIKTRESSRGPLVRRPHGLTRVGYNLLSLPQQGFPGSSAGKESACSAGDPSSIHELGRSPGEGNGYPPQYSSASIVAQLVKNPPAMQETWVWSLGLGRSPGEGNGYPPQYSGLENPMDCIVHWVAKSQTRLSNFHFPNRDSKREKGLYFKISVNIFFQKVVKIKVNRQKYLPL